MQLNINEQKKELKPHGNYSFPVNISKEILSYYEGGNFLWHWHPEIEITYIVEGKINYTINDKSYILKNGEGIFGNSNTMHNGYMINNEDCIYLSITFHPRFIYGFENSIIQTKYMNFLIDNNKTSSLKLSDNILWQKEALLFLKNLYEKKFIQNIEIDELYLHIEISKIWLNIYNHFLDLNLIDNIKSNNEYNIDRIKEILTFIHNNYNEPITLDDISKNINLCKSECCRFFKKNMNITLFEYIMFYRVQQSLSLLNTNLSITEISEKCGFSNSCYYGKIFKRYFKCTPTEYKKYKNSKKTNKD